jgi:hypothetical protein
MYLDHESLKLETKEKRIIKIMNVFDIDMKDHREDHDTSRKQWRWCRFRFNGLIWRKVSRWRWIFILTVII